MVYDSTDAFAYGMLELIGTFVARVSLNKAGLEKLKEILPEYCGTASTSSEYGRAIAAAINQFIIAVEKADNL